MAATNPEILKSVKNSIFIREVLEKSKNGGLVWDKLSGDHFKATEFQASDCISPARVRGMWELHVTRVNVNGSEEPRYFLDVVKDGSIYLSFNSQESSIVQDIYDNAEELAVNSTADLDDALKFFGKVGD